MALRLALAHADELVAHGLSSMLRGSGAAHHVSDLAAPGPFHIALYDPSGSQDAHGRIGRLRDDARVAKVVVYTWNFQPWSAGEWIRHGASGYLSKSLPAGPLVSALEAIHAGRVIVAPGQQSSSASVGWPGRDEGLTPREAEALSLIAGGLSNREVAERMTLSPNSVKSYIRTAYRKIGVNSRSQAVLWAMTNGLGPTTGQRRDQAVAVVQR